MEQKDIIFIKAMFKERFSFMEDWVIIWNMMKEDIISDIEETADKDFTSGDVDIAIERTLLNRL